MNSEDVLDKLYWMWKILLQKDREVYFLSEMLNKKTNRLEFGEEWQALYSALMLMSEDAELCFMAFRNFYSRNENAITGEVSDEME
jgi:hypothetical protein